jgi:AraC-like DNA-binding protein
MATRFPSGGLFCVFLLVFCLFISIFAPAMNRITKISGILLVLLVLSLRVSAVGFSRGEMLANQADSLYGLQQYGEALRLAEQALPLSRSEGNTQLEADCLNLLAIIHIRQGQFSEAVKYAKQCYKLDERSGDPDAMSSSLNTLAGIYMSMRQPQEAEKYVLKAIQYASKVDNPERLAVLHGMASEVYHILKQEELSLSYATKAYEMEQRLGRKDKMAIRQAMRANALIALQRDAEARWALDEAIPGLRASGNIHSLGIACNQMGLLMHQDHNDSAAVRYFNEALKIFLAQNDLFNESKSRHGLYEALRHTDPDLAMEHNDRYMELRDSLYDKDTGELLAKYAVEYGYDELQARNTNLLHSLRLYILVGVVLLLALLVYGLWSRRNYRRRMQDLIRQIESLSNTIHEPDALGLPLATEGTQEELAEAPQPEPSPAMVPEPAEAQSSDIPHEDRLFLMHLVQVVNDGLPSGQIGVEAIASEMNMSIQTFRRRLLSVTGESPKAFISAIQMERAAKLLLDSPDMPIARVATLCGYDETNSFGRSFKRAYGVTSSQYREQSL